MSTRSGMRPAGLWPLLIVVSLFSGVVLPHMSNNAAMLFLGGLSIASIAALVDPLVPFTLWLGTTFVADLRPEGWPLTPGQIAGAAFVASAAAAGLRTRWSVSTVPVGRIVLLCLFAAYLAASAWFGDDPERGHAQARSPVFLCAAALAVALSLRTKAHWLALAWAVVLSTAVAAIPGLLEALEKGALSAAIHGNFSHGVRIRGTAPNPIVFAWNIVWAIPFAVFLFQVQRPRVARYAALGLAVFSLAVAMLSLNRQTAVLAMVAAGSSVLLGRSSRRRNAVLAIASVAVLAGATLALPSIARRFAAPAELASDPSFLERRDSFLIAFEAIRQKPVFGIGLGSFPGVWRNYLPVDPRMYFAQNNPADEPRFIDSGYLQVAAETGFTGLSLAAVTILSIVVGVGRARLRALRTSDSFAANASTLILSGLLFVAVSTLLQDTVLHTRFWILLGMGLVASTGIDSDTECEPPADGALIDTSPSP